MKSFRVIKFSVILIFFLSSLKTPESKFDKIKITTISIAKADFKKLIDILPVDTYLYFVSYYDNKLFKDLVTHKLYYQDGNLMKNYTDGINVLLEAKTFKDVFYQSTYRKSKTDLSKLIMEFDQIPEFEYVLIKPGYYSNNNNFVSFKIVPANNKRNEISYPKKLDTEDQLDPSPPATWN